jgi:hypothetical protein
VHDVRAISDRLSIILGEALIDEIERAESEGQDILAWQFGALDALTKQVAGAVTACVIMVRKLALSQRDFVVFRERVHRQLEPIVLALLNGEIAQGGAQQDLPWPYDQKRSGHA